MEIKRCYDTLIGASVGENQLVQSGATSVTVQSGHKYYAKIDGTESLGTSTGSAITINDSAKDMVIDLSLYLPANIVDYIYSLESATAGSGISKLREWGFLRGYQAYNAGSLESVEVTGKVVRGFNQWDEEWKLGGYTSTNGEYSANNSTICSKNPIPIMPDVAYYAMSTVITTNFQVRFYDADMNYIGYVQKNGAACAWNRAFVTPSNAYYMNFQVQADYGTTYNNDICINLSSSRNGEYEAYAEQSYDYGDDTLNGIFKLDVNNNLYADGDVKTSDGTITRKYKLGDLGSLNWTYWNGLFYADVSDKNSTNTERNILCGKYASYPTNFSNASSANTNMSDKQLAGFVGTGTSSFVYVKDSSYTDATAFKQMLTDQNVKMVYELATPTTEQGDPFPSPQVCYPDGTEEYVTSNGVPVGHETRYEL